MIRVYIDSDRHEVLSTYVDFYSTRIGDKVIRLREMHDGIRVEVTNVRRLGAASSKQKELEPLAVFEVKAEGGVRDDAQPTELPATPGRSGPGHSGGAGTAS